jgi:hypothetical protein
VFVKDARLKKLTKFSTIGVPGKGFQGNAWKDTSASIVAQREIDHLSMIGDHNFVIKIALIPTFVNVAEKK